MRHRERADRVSSHLTADTSMGRTDCSWTAVGKCVPYWRSFALHEGAARTAASRQTPRSVNQAGPEQDAHDFYAFLCLRPAPPAPAGRARRSVSSARPPFSRKRIPPALEGRDVLASAMTGSGKTAAFALPILQRLGDRPRGTTRALVLTPTRELAAQIDEHLRDLAGHTRLTSATVFGGLGMRPQEQAFRRGVDVIVATPGRLLDHMRSPYAALRGLEILVLDEADRMLDMGFLPDVRRILRQIPARAADPLLLRHHAAPDRGALARDAPQPGHHRDPAQVGPGHAASPRRPSRCPPSSSPRSSPSSSSPARSAA